VGSNELRFVDDRMSPEPVTFPPFLYFTFSFLVAKTTIATIYVFRFV
jgi:hypothetical protein